MAALGRAIRALFRTAVWIAFLGVVSLGLYTGYLIKVLDVSRQSIEARARSVEASVVPSRAAGPQGAYYDTALEVPLSLAPERIPDFVKNAFITREDQFFRWHPGFNPISIYRALRANAERAPGASGGLAGGSTITQQLVKNLLLSQEQTLDRKFNEIILAVIVEFLFTKDELLAMYLNTAYFGAGAYGIEAAARRFFGRSVGYEPKLNMLEAAMLAHSVRSPSRLNPLSQREVLKERGQALIAEMAAQGYRTDAGQAARRPGARTWSLDPFLFRDVAMRSMIPAEIQARTDSVTLGFTIDSEAQLYAELAATDLLNRGRAAGYDSSAIVVLEPDGAIVALATGHRYDGVDVVQNGRVSPGSTLKPFLFLCALENGLRPDSRVQDREREMRPGWTPKNFDGRYLGAITLDVALRKSRNATAVELFDRFGASCFADALRRVGIELDDPAAPTAVLGSGHVPLLKLAAAYAALANGGVAVEPYAIRYARAKNGALIYRRPPPPLGPKVADERPYCDLMTMLRNVTRADATGNKAAFSHPVYGKTGTSSRYRDALFAGFTRDYVAVVWLGRQARGDVTGRMTGGQAPAEIFRWLMATLHDGKEAAPIDCRGPATVASRETGP